MRKLKLSYVEDLPGLECSYRFAKVAFSAAAHTVV
jgi:hypothetical protein